MTNTNGERAGRLNIFRSWRKTAVALVVVGAIGSACTTSTNDADRNHNLGLCVEGKRAAEEFLRDEDIKFGNGNVRTIPSDSALLRECEEDQRTADILGTTP